ncbi:hypothetical protein AOR_1_992134 [Paecilomyces variotii No. 5]|uniref:Mitochondrial fusion protein n=1 Tax=Byssochlamys spectabilis (strain No. 5 / NBRC 109023) TaxID=1356009 RepID=V5FI10_BYSSN|nr:hypothetical protein AOR_1_992134 [Paecilomyces variotii No. 5]
MSSSREGVNPLRPYYVPPQIGLSPGPATSNASAPPNAPSASTKAFGSSARDLLSDLDYSDYLESSPSVSDWVREALDRAVWRYTSVLMAQPFDVAKTILQVYVVPDAQDGQAPPDERRRQSQGYREQYVEEDSQSSDDESSYFTSAAPGRATPSTPRSRGSRHRITDRSGYIPSPGIPPRHALVVKNPSSLMEVISQLWSTSGPTSVWKGANATFIHSLLLPTLNTFIRSLLSAILGMPEEAIASPMTADILTAASPITTLILSFISSALSSIILSPIDTARTYLIVTPTTQGPRSLLRAIRLLPTPNYVIPPHLIPITILHSSLPNLLSTSTPLFLKTYLSLDPVLNPSSWSVCSFLASCLELGVKYPLETVLRRAQIATFTSPSLRQKGRVPASPTIPSPATAGKQPSSEIETIVPAPRSYRGVVGTIWSIIYEEGVSPSPSESEKAHEMLGKPVPSRQRRRQGQGIQGLYRGWRVGMWGLAGVWGAGFLGAAMGGGEEEIVTSTAASGMSPVSARGRNSGGVF